MFQAETVITPFRLPSILQIVWELCRHEYENDHTEKLDDFYYEVIMGVIHKLITEQRRHDNRRTKTLLDLYLGPAQILLRAILSNKIGRHLIKWKKKGYTNPPKAAVLYGRYLKRNVSRRTDLNMFVAASVWALAKDGSACHNLYIPETIREIVTLYADDFLGAKEKAAWLGFYQNGYVDGLVEMLKPKRRIKAKRRPGCCSIL